MNLKIDLNILNDSNHFRVIDELIHLIESGKHTLLFEADKLDTLIESDWFEGLGERQQDLIYELFQKSAVNASFKSKSELQSRPLIKVAEENNLVNGIDNLIRVLGEPLLIVIEDIVSDQLFIRRLIEVYKNAGKRISRALELGWCRFSHSGGKTRTPQIIINHLADRPQPFKPRIIVVIDSDKTHQDSHFSVETQRVIDICSENSFPLHIYEKREIENYTPDLVLRKRIPAGLRETTRCYCLMSPIQKDFFDFELGFNFKRPTEYDPLYAEYHESSDYGHLKGGFTNDNFNAKREIFTFVKDDDFNQLNIAERCAHQEDPEELKNLLIKIDSLL